MGELHLTDKQLLRLGVKAHTQISPYLEKCCLIVSANVSYQNAAKDVKYLTGIEVSSKTQQRLVHRQEFKLPIQNQEIKELSTVGDTRTEVDYLSHVQHTIATDPEATKWHLIMDCLNTHQSAGKALAA